MPRQIPHRASSPATGKTNDRLTSSFCGVLRKYTRVVGRFGYGKCWINYFPKSHTTILKRCQSSKEQPLLRKRRSNTTRSLERERRRGGRMSTLQRLTLGWRPLAMKLSKGIYFPNNNNTYNFANTSQWYNQREEIGRSLHARCRR